MAINFLSRYFLEQHPRESAKILENYSPDLILQYLQDIPDERVANLIRYIMPDLAVSCLTELPADRTAQILEHLDIDGTARLLSRMKYQTQNVILNSMPVSLSRRLRLVLKYPIGTVGHYMSPDIFIGSEDMLVGDLITSAKSSASELLDDIFIIDDQQLLIGVVDVKHLVYSDAEDEVQKIMKIPDTVLNVRTNLEYVKDNPRWRFKETLPVVDQKNIFVGVLRRSTMNDVLSGEQTQESSQVGITETVIDVADLFWEICFSFIYPNTESTNKVDLNDRSKTRN